MYRLAALWAALAIPFWMAAVWFWPGDAWPQAVRSIDWHARAMVTGFAGAVIVSFLVAPARRWPEDRGALAWSLTGAWLAARGLSLSPLPLAQYAVYADLLFFGIAAVVLVRRALRSPSPNNLLFAAAPLALMMSVRVPLPVLELISVLVAVIAGRVIPGLVNARLPSRPARIRVELDRIAIGAQLLAIAMNSAWPNSAATDLVWAFAALAHLQRWWNWAPLQAIGTDLRLSMMLIAYAWLPIWLLTGAAGEWAPHGAATHALGAGLVGGMIWSMMNRTLAGATESPGWVERIGAVALVVGVLARFALAFVSPAWSSQVGALAVVGWSVAFLSLAVRGGGEAGSRPASAISGASR